MGFLNGLVKVATAGLNVSGKVASAVGTTAGKVGAWTTKGVLKGTGKIATSRAFMKEASEKVTENMSFVDKVFQNATGLAKESADGTMKYKTLTKGGFLALAGSSMLIDTGKVATGQMGQTSRGMVSVADNMERFISYDGSGFVNNVDDVAGGDPAVLNDIVNHTFTSQRSALNDNSLKDIVFALHANREG